MDKTKETNTPEDKQEKSTNTPPAKPRKEGANTPAWIQKAERSLNEKNKKR